MTSVEEVTPELLAGMGVTSVMLQTAIASGCREWIRNMCLAGEYTVALRTAVEVLHSSDLENAEKRSIADLWLVAAWLYWRQKGFLNSLLALAHAVVTRPVVVGRPLTQLLHRFESVRWRKRPGDLSAQGR
jgi:hypothetical protein